MELLDEKLKVNNDRLKKKKISAGKAVQIYFRYIKDFGKQFTQVFDQQAFNILPLFETFFTVINSPCAKSVPG